MIQQKVSLKGLKLLVDFEGMIGTGYYQFPKGSVAYVKEELLFTQQWAKQILESDAVEGKFIIVDAQYVEMVGRTFEDPI
jgi:hypothetical protein